MADMNPTYSRLEQCLLNDFQHDLPLTPTPFADVAERLGVSEDEVLVLIGQLQERGVISRVGPVFTPNRIGVSTLAAMSIPPAARSGARSAWLRRSIRTLPASCASG